ncbi:MAG: hypothetical protein DRI90_05745 [Deltaproteobacteria bacterium]|nr:MAG: hypothetical protein DRI90_05745 [Deltaproteobacteria bacterium]
MSTESDGRNIATKKSGHKVVAGPEISKNPPTPPAGPIPGPYVIAASSSTAKSTGAKLTVGGGEALTIDSVMDADPPANQPSQPTGGDIQTFAVKGKVPVTSATATLKVSGKDVARTGDRAAVNTIAPQQEMAQMTGVLMEGASLAAGGGSAGGDGSASGSTAAGKPAQSADQEPAPGASSSPKAPSCEKDPVAVLSGFVIDSDDDLTLPGAIELSWSRHYSTQRHREQGLLGKGGWVLSLEQWVQPGEGRLEVRLEDGRSAYFEPIEAGQKSFHRRERLELHARARGGTLSYQLYDLSTRLWRDFAPQVSGGLARLTAISDAHGNTIRLQYEGDRLGRVIDTAGRELRLSHTDQGYLSRVEVWARPPRTPAERDQGVPAEELSLQTWIDYAYDSDECLAQVTDALGYSDRYQYDIERRRTCYTLKNGQSFYYAYDPVHGRCIKTWGDDGLHSGVFERRPDHEVFTHGGPEPRHYQGTEDGFTLLEETLDQTYQRKRQYDDDRYLLSEENAAGHAYQFGYDSRGNRTSVIDPAGNETQWELLDDLPVKHISPEGHQTRYTHDERGQLVGAAYPTGERYRLGYDTHGRVTDIHGSGQDGAAGPSFGFAYDEHHNLIEETDSRGAAARYRYDALGRPIERSDALGRITHVTYDLLGQPTAIRYPDGSHTATTYDPLGNVASFTDALGHTTHLRYAGTGVLVELSEPATGASRGSQRWRFVYDKAERLRKIINPRREEYEYRYDAVGRVIEERPFDGRVLRYQYDKAEQLSRIERPDQSWRRFHYDPLGNVVSDHCPDGAITFKRDKLGRLLEARVDEDEGQVVTVLERDELGRVIAEEQDGKRITYQLDRQGRHIARTLPNEAGGATTRYRYDAFGAFTEVEHDDHKVAVERDALGRETRRTVAGDAFEQLRSYDAMDRLAEQVVQTAQRGAALGQELSQLSHRKWHYDRAGRPTAMEDDRWGTTTYQYDPLGQLIEARRGGRSEVFEYDVTGSLQNILSSLDQVGHIAPWRIEQGNVLTEKNGVRYENDRCCRRTKKVEPAETRGGPERTTTYHWDVRDRLREVGLADGRRVYYRYDAFARRVEKEIVTPLEGQLHEQLTRALSGEGAPPLQTETTTFLWDGDVLCAELRGDVSAETPGVRVHVHEPGTFVPLLQVEDGQAFTVVGDHLGMPKELIDPQGRVAWAAAHSAWGKVVEAQRDSGTAEVESPFRLLGQYHDEETGLCYTRHRYFDAETGRWCSPDPLGLAGGRNLAAFDGAPGSDVDPLGLACPAAQAKAQQGNEDYPGVDDWKNVIIPKGTRLVMGEPGAAGFFTTPDAVASVGAGRRAVFEGLQVKRHETHGYRSRMGVYEFIADTPAATSTTSANTGHGAGGLPQFYVPDWQTNTARLGEIPLGP